MGERADTGRAAGSRGARVAGGARLTADHRAPAPAGQGLLHLLLDPLAPGRRVPTAAAAHQPQPGLGGQGQAGAIQVSQDLLAQHRPDVATFGQGARDRHRVGEVTGERLPGPATRAPGAWGTRRKPRPAPPRPNQDPGPQGTGAWLPQSRRTQPGASTSSEAPRTQRSAREGLWEELPLGQVQLGASPRGASSTSN